MRANIVLLVFIVTVLAFNSNAQIKVLSNGYVGLGVGNTNPQANVDILGYTTIRPSSSGSFASFGSGSPFGWTLTGSAQYTSGYIGYYSTLYAIDAQYVYGANLTSSDEKLKKNIKSVQGALPIIKKLRPVTFDYNKDYSKTDNEQLKAKMQKDDKDRLGFIAQEVQQILPQSVKVRESDSTLCILMTDFIPLLVKGLQEQTAQIDSLKTVIREMKDTENMQKSAVIPGDGNTLNSSAMLYQNMPNPFSRETKIGCLIPETANTSVLYIYNMNGTQLQQYSITGKGKQMVTIFGSTLEPGMYLYALVIDGREVDTKRMILTK